MIFQYLDGSCKKQSTKEYIKDGRFAEYGRPPVVLKNIRGRFSSCLR